MDNSHLMHKNVHLKFNRVLGFKKKKKKKLPFLADMHANNKATKGF
jgi:hypothetical protein